MSRRRFYVPPERIHEGVAELSRDQAHRLRNVLRLGDDCEVEIIDGKGNSYTGRLGLEGHQARVFDLKPFAGTGQRSPRLVVAAAIIKPARFEWMLEKATELGADEFIPLTTRYFDIHLARGSQGPRLERWRRIVRHACEQCGRLVVPTIRTPLSFLDLLQSNEFSDFTRLLCYETGGVPLTRQDSDKPVVLCTGPEGGWARHEIDAALAAGYELVSLGPNTLRAETAVIAAVTLLRIGN